jgi:predicted sulfurtransferase
MEQTNAATITWCEICRQPATCLTRILDSGARQKICWTCWDLEQAARRKEWLKATRADRMARRRREKAAR